MNPNLAYISGGISGVANENRAAFLRAAKRWRDKGYEVICPVELDGPNDPCHDDPENWWYFMERDLAIIWKRKPGVIVVVTPYTGSFGCGMEVLMGMKYGAKVVPDANS